MLTLADLADALSEWIKAEGFEHAHLVANSFGCQILAELAVRHPQQVDRLVFQGPTIDRRARTLWLQLGRLIANSRQESPHLGRIMFTDYARAGLKRVVHTIKIALHDRIEDKLPHIVAPTLVIRGEDDALVPQQWAEEVCTLLPHGQLSVVPRTAHTMNYTSPDVFVAAIRPFLAL
jgi:pimeloyl-ACP methyl ester carboxylesterase